MSASPLRALLVEDNPGDARLVRALLGEAHSLSGARPVELETADRLDAAQAALARSRFDVVLLDLTLPDSEGLATLAGILTHSSTIPVVVLSGLSDERVALLAVEAGAQDYLMKGQFDGALLMRAIRYAVERKRAAGKVAQLHAELGKSAREWRVTFDTLDIAVMLVSGDGLVRRMNRAARALTERDFKENIGHSLPQLSGLFPWSRTLALLQRAMATKQSAGAQLKDRVSGRIWDCAANYFLNPEAADEGIVFSAREITTLVKLQESLRRGEMMSTLGSLVAGVAHEVRNPLFGIVATLDAFEANHGDRPEFREYLAILRGESERLSALMKDLLDYGHPPVLNPDRGSIEALLRDALGPVQALAQPAGVLLELECAPGLPEVSFDRSRLPQVFINLLDNAVRHSPSGGTVRLSAALAADPGWLECAVADEGPGLQPEDLPRLFQPFFTRRAGGTGLGLAIVQRIVEQHGGQIRADNSADGGAVFIVRLPLVDPSH